MLKLEVLLGGSQYTQGAGTFRRSGVSDKMRRRRLPSDRGSRESTEAPRSATGFGNGVPFAEGRRQGARSGRKTWMEGQEGTRRSDPQQKGAPGNPTRVRQGGSPALGEPSDSRDPGPAASLEASSDPVLTHPAPLQGRTSRTRRSADRSSIPSS